jgi:hypothetical protein
VDLKLRLGIGRLLQRKYLPILGNESKFLVAGLVNWALCDQPESEEAKKFLDTNQTLIEEEAEKLHQDQAVSCALSILYTFTLIWLGPTNPDKSARLVERATELNILILSVRELGFTDDAVQFLAFIDKFSDGILQK